MPWKYAVEMVDYSTCSFPLSRAYEAAPLRASAPVGFPRPLRKACQATHSASSRAYSQVIEPRNLPIDYGGTSPVVYPTGANRDNLPSTPQAIGLRETFLLQLLTGGNTSYEVRGLHAVALLAVLWALYHKSVRVGEITLLALAMALVAREWTGGAVTLATVNLRAPLVRDAGGIRAAGEEFVNGGAPADIDHEGEGVISNTSRVNTEEILSLRPELKVRGRSYKRGNGTTVTVLC